MLLFIAFFFSDEGIDCHSGGRGVAKFVDGEEEETFDPLDESDDVITVTFDFLGDFLLLFGGEVFVVVKVAEIIIHHPSSVGVGGEFLDIAGIFFVEEEEVIGEGIQIFFDIPQFICMKIFEGVFHFIFEVPGDREGFAGVGDIVIEGFFGRFMIHDSALGDKILLWKKGYIWKMFTLILVLM